MAKLTTFACMSNEEEVLESLQDSNYKFPKELIWAIRTARLFDFELLVIIVWTVICLLIAYFIWGWKFVLSPITLVIVGSYALLIFILVIKSMVIRIPSYSFPNELFKRFYLSLYTGLHTDVLDISTPTNDTDIAYTLLAPSARNRPGCSSFKEFKKIWDNHLKNLKGMIFESVQDNIAYEYKVDYVNIKIDKVNHRIASGNCIMEVTPKKWERNVATTCPSKHIAYNSKAIMYDNKWYILTGEPGSRADLKQSK